MRFPNLLPKRAPLKVVLAPMNIAGMPMEVVRGLRARGHQVEQVHYHGGQGHAFGFDLDVAPDYSVSGGRIACQAQTLSDYLTRDFKIFHFWKRTLFYDLQNRDNTGLDLLLLKARGKRIVHRFTGFDLRLPSWDLEKNPHSPFRHGYELEFPEKSQKIFFNFLRQYVDAFVVADPEMAQFAPPGTRIIPRTLRVSEWDPVGVGETDRPLVVHAPSNPEVKGTRFILDAVAALREEGVAFDFKLIERLSHAEARAWYARADIIVDQLLIGAAGVTTLEAWALGKPCLVNLRRDLFEPFYGVSDLPVANATPDTIRPVLKALIGDAAWRRRLSVEGRRLVERFHDVDVVIPQYEAFYRSLMRRSPRRPKGLADVRYLAYQTRLAESARTAEQRSRKRLAQAEARLQELTVEVDALRTRLALHETDGRDGP